MPVRIDRACALLSLIATIATVPAGAQTAPDGVTYRVRVTTRLPVVGGGGAGVGPVVLARAVALGGRARIDFQTVEPAVKGGLETDYVVVDDSARLVTVSPDTRSFRDGSDVVTSVRAFAGGDGSNGFAKTLKALITVDGVKRADAAAALGIGKGRDAPPPAKVGASSTDIAQFRDVTVQVTSLGAAEDIEGRATQHYRLAVSYTILRGADVRPARFSIEAWTVQLPVTPINPFDPFGSGVYAPTGSSVELDAKLAAARRQLDGVPVRLVVTSPVAESALKGAEPVGPLEIVQTIQLTQIVPAPASTIDPLALSIPLGFVRRKP